MRLRKGLGSSGAALMLATTLHQPGITYSNLPTSYEIFQSYLNTSK